MALHLPDFFDEAKRKIARSAFLETLAIERKNDTPVRRSGGLGQFVQQHRNRPLGSFLVQLVRKKLRAKELQAKHRFLARFLALLADRLPRQNVALVPGSQILVLQLRIQRPQ